MQVLSDEGNTTEGGTLRKLSLLATLSMVATLVFAPTAIAQDVDCPQLTFAEAQAILAEDPSDPNGLDADNDGTACDANAGDGSTASPMAEETMMESASPMAEESATPMAEESATATATASASASPLPDTGGVVSPAALSLIAALLLVGGGIMSASIARRR